MTTRKTSYSNAIVFALLAILSSALSALGFYSWSTAGSGVPSRDELYEIVGSIDPAVPVLTHRYYVEFQLDDEEPELRYMSKSGRMNELAAALREHPQSVRVLVNHEHYAAHLRGERSSVIVYQVIAGGRTVHSLEELRAAWVENDSIGMWLGIWFLFSAGLFAQIGYRQWHPPKPSPKSHTDAR